MTRFQTIDIPFYCAALRMFETLGVEVWLHDPAIFHDPTKMPRESSCTEMKADYAFAEKHLKPFARVRRQDTCSIENWRPVCARGNVLHLSILPRMGLEPQRSNELRSMFGLVQLWHELGHALLYENANERAKAEDCWPYPVRLSLCSEQEMEAYARNATRDLFQFWRGYDQAAAKTYAEDPSWQQLLLALTRWSPTQSEKLSACFTQRAKWLVDKTFGK